MRIAKRCHLTSIVKCVKLLFQKVLKKFVFTVVIAVAVWTLVRQITQPLHKKKSCNLNFHKHLFSTFRKINLTTDVMFSGQRFAILTMFSFYLINSEEVQNRVTALETIIKLSCFRLLSILNGFLLISKTKLEKKTFFSGSWIYSYHKRIVI